MKIIKFIALILIIPMVLSLAACKYSYDQSGAEATPDVAPATDAVATAIVTPVTVTDAPATPVTVTDAPATPVKATDAPATPVTVTDAPATPKDDNVTRKIAYQLYKLAIEKNNGLNDITIIEESVSDMSISLAGVTLKTNAVNRAECKVKNNLKKDMIVEAHQIQTSSGDLGDKTSETTVFMDEANVYVSNDGGAFTIVSRSSETGKQFDETIAALMENSKDGIKEAAFSGAKLTKKQDGSTIIELSPTDDQMNEMVRDNIDTMLTTMGNLGADNLEYKISGAKIIIEIDPNGYLVGVQSDFVLNMEMVIMGMPSETTASISGSSKFADIGKPVEITLPGNDGDPGENAEAFRLYKTAQGKTKGLNDFVCVHESDGDITLTLLGTSLDMNMSILAESKFKNFLKDDMMFEIHQSKTVSGSGSIRGSKQDIIMDKDHVYVRADDDPYTVLSRSSIQSEIDELVNDVANDEAIFTEDMFRGAKIITKPDGSCRIELTPNNTQVLDLLRDNIDSSMSTMEDIGAEDINYTINKAEIYIEIDSDGYLCESLIDCDLDVTMNIQGLPATAKMLIKSSEKYTDIGKSVVIDIPNL